MIARSSAYAYFLETVVGWWEQWVDDWIDTSIDDSLEDFKGDTHQRYGTVVLCVPQRLLSLRDRNY